MFTLRDYQGEAVRNILADWRDGFRRVLLMAATGTGKTVMFLEVLHRVISDPLFTRALIIAHTEELIFQPQERAMEMYPHLGLKMGTVMGAADNYSAQIVVGTVQTLSQNGRMGKILAAGPISHVIIDEAHHAIADSYQAVLSQLDDPFVLGCTATPKRTDKVGLGTYFQKVAYKITIQDAIRAGALVPFTPFGFSLPITVPDNWKAPEGDGENRKLGQLLSAENVLEIVFNKWQEFAGNRQTIIFTASVAQAHTQAAYFSEMGIPAKAVDGSTKKEERRAILKAFKAGELRVLANCQVLTEGFDAPETSCVVMAAPTGSDLVYVQRLGRGLRTAPGKEDCLVLDFAPTNARNLIFAGDVLEGVPKQVREQAERADAAGILFEGGFTVDKTGQVGFVDPFDVTAKVLDYLGKHHLAWTFDGHAATTTVNETTTLCIMVPDRERIEKADEVRRTKGLNDRSKRVLDWISSYRVYSIIRPKTEKGYGRSTVTLQTEASTFDEAKRFCDEKWGDEADRIGEKAQKWRKSPASNAQVKLLGNLGIESQSLTKGQAAQKITHALALKQVLPVEEGTQRSL